MSSHKKPDRNRSKKGAMLSGLEFVTVELRIKIPGEEFDDYVQLCTGQDEPTHLKVVLALKLLDFFTQAITTTK